MEGVVMPDFHQGTLVVTQPPHYPTMHTRETVQSLAAFGLDENQVAVILRCTPDDVRRYYVVEMEHGLTMVNSRVMSAVLHEALYNRDMTAAKLWLINKAGWRAGDSNKISLPNPNDVTAPGDGTLTIVQRREVITKLLVHATQEKRKQERVIEGEIVPKANGKANGNGANGHGSNGTNGGGNGAKHK
jgi:hypothetical protein